MSPLFPSRNPRKAPLIFLFLALMLCSQFLLPSVQQVCGFFSSSFFFHRACTLFHAFPLPSPHSPPAPIVSFTKHIKLSQCKRKEKEPLWTVLACLTREDGMVHAIVRHCQSGSLMIEKRKCLLRKIQTANTLESTLSTTDTMLGFTSLLFHKGLM